MWEQPLDRLTEKQIHLLSRMSAQEQLKLLGGEQAFNARDQQCVSKLKAE